MAKLIYGMNVSLDGYVDHDKFAPDPVLFRYFIEQTRNTAGSIYGRGLYELMRYWDGDEWVAEPQVEGDPRAFAEAWRAMPKWVASRSLMEVGPNATLLGDDLENAELWLAIAPRKPAAKKKAADPLAAEVKVALTKYKAAAALKAERLVRYMLPDRATVPKSMPAALKLLRTYHSETEIAEGARALMKQLENESGTDVPL